MAQRSSENLKRDMASPGDGIFSITPHDTNLLAHDARAILVTEDGNLEITSFDELGGDGVAVVVPLIAGQMLRCRVKKVHAANTTISAGNIFGLT